MQIRTRGPDGQRLHSDVPGSPRLRGSPHGGGMPPATARGATSRAGGAAAHHAAPLPPSPHPFQRDWLDLHLEALEEHPLLRAARRAASSSAANLQQLYYSGAAAGGGGPRGGRGKPPRKQQWRSTLGLAAVALAVIGATSLVLAALAHGGGGGAALLLLGGSGEPPQPRLLPPAQPAGGLPSPPRSTLVLYAAVQLSDPQAVANTQHFVASTLASPPAKGVRVLHVLLLPQDATGLVARLPALPVSMELQLHARGPECDHGWGVFGAYLATNPAAALQHAYFVLLTSAVSGPHMPTYATGRLHWTQAFTNKLARSKDTKLVGSIISCQAAATQVDGTTAVRSVPHVLAEGAVATDQEGLALLLNAPGVFSCHATHADARYYTAAGASMAVLQAGRNLDCLLWRYQGIDWRLPSSSSCNAGLPPTLERGNGGTNLDPLEVMFVPLLAGAVQQRPTWAHRAAKYTTWAREVPHGNLSVVLGNEYFAESQRVAALKKLQLMARGGDCFDGSAYYKAYPDLHSLPSEPGALWQHWREHGSKEGRQAFWTCSDANHTASIVQPTLAAAEALAAAVPELQLCDGDLAALWGALGSRPRACVGAQPPLPGPAAGSGLGLPVMESPRSHHKLPGATQGAIDSTAAQLRQGVHIGVHTGAPAQQLMDAAPARDVSRQGPTAWQQRQSGTQGGRPRADGTQPLPDRRVAQGQGDQQRQAQPMPMHLREKLRAQQQERLLARQEAEREAHRLPPVHGGGQQAEVAVPHA